MFAIILILAALANLRVIAAGNAATAHVPDSQSSATATGVLLDRTAGADSSSSTITEDASGSNARHTSSSYSGPYSVSSHETTPPRHFSPFPPHFHTFTDPLNRLILNLSIEFNDVEWSFIWKSVARLDFRQ